jgi:hypothetical protein
LESAPHFARGKQLERIGETCDEERKRKGLWKGSGIELAVKASSHIIRREQFTYTW